MKRLRRHGRAGTLSVNACFQCGNCTAVCTLAKDSAGFPRRLIRMAQVGMERELLASEDLWRCYACGECARTCPSEADPAEFMAAARSYAISRYDFTGLAALANRSALGNLVIFVLFSAVFSLLLASKENPAGPRAPLFDFLPGWWIHNIGVALFAIAGLSAAFGMFSMVWRFWVERRREGAVLRIAALPGAVASALLDALLHRQFLECTAEDRISAGSIEPLYLRTWFVHAAVMAGFLAMLIATTLDFLLKPIGSPVPPWYPMRLLGVAGGLICLYGLAIVLLRRLRAAEVPWLTSSFADWFFPVILAATVLTGLITDAAVYLPLGSAGHGIFLLHVVLAMDLVALLPLTKFAHVLYRTLALALFAWRRAPASEAVTAEAQV